MDKPESKDNLFRALTTLAIIAAGILGNHFNNSQQATENKVTTEEAVSANATNNNLQLIIKNNNAIYDLQKRLEELEKK